MDKATIRNVFIVLFFILITIIMKGINSIDFNKEKDDIDYEKVVPREEENYIIQDYKVYISLNKDNTVNVKEKFSIFCNERKEKIYKTMPMYYRGNGNNNLSEIKKMELKDLKVSDNFKLVQDKNNYMLYIGTEGEYLPTRKTFNLEYTYDLGEDTNKYYDEFRYNIISHGINTKIESLDFTIKLPEDFVIEDLAFTSGKFGKMLLRYPVLYRDNNIIKGGIYQIINPYEALNIRMKFPNNSFIIAKPKTNILDIIYLAIPIITLLISLYFWYRYSKGKYIENLLEPNIPQNLNPLEAAFVFKHDVDNEDIMSLLMHLANKRYLEIILNQEGYYEIVKLRDYDGDNKYEKMFYDGIFTTDYVTKVKVTDLKFDFYKTVSAIKKEIKKEEEHDNVFDKSFNKNKILITLLLFISMITLINIPGYNTLTKKINILYGIIYPILAISLLFNFDNKNIRKVLSVIVIFFAPLVLISTFKNIMLNTTYYKISFAIGIICCIISGVIIKRLHKRTEYGKDIYWRLKDFRNFLLKADDNILEMLLTENSNYFYDMLPYTYVFGLTDIWILKFNDIQIAEPKLYYNKYQVNYKMIKHFIKKDMKYIVKDAIVYPATWFGIS